MIYFKKIIYKNNLKCIVKKKQFLLPKDAIFNKKMNFL